jgi:hypothetical protein
LRLFSHHSLQALPDFLPSVSANLEPSLFEFRTKGFDVCLHPECNECRPVTDSSPVLAVEQNPATSEVVHATADRTKGDIRMLGEDAVWRVDEFGTDKDGHDGLDPTLLRATWCRSRILGWLAALHVNEQARGLQMSVACEIEIVDLGAFQGGSLLWADVGRENQKSVADVVGRQSRPPTVQLINDDANVLVAEMPFLLDKVANGSLTCLPSNYSIKAAQELRWRADLGLGHPFLESSLVPLEVRRFWWTLHVH